MGLSHKFALKFSFIMSIPPILGAALLDVKDIVKPGSTALAKIGACPLIMGMLVAAVSGYIAIRFMLRIFSGYVFVSGTLIVLEQLLNGRIFQKLF